MLENLYITNGVVSPAFDSLVNIYTINVESDITSLNLDYEVSGNYSVVVINNDNFVSGENTVIIEVNDNLGNIEEYTLLVYKDNSVSTFDSNNTLEKLEVAESVPVPNYVIPLLIISCLIIISVVFKLLFLNKKKTK